MRPPDNLLEPYLLLSDLRAWFEQRPARLAAVVALRAALRMIPLMPIRGADSFHLEVNWDALVGAWRSIEGNVAFDERHVKDVRDQTHDRRETIHNQFGMRHGVVVRPMIDVLRTGNAHLPPERKRIEPFVLGSLSLALEVVLRIANEERVRSNPRGALARLLKALGREEQHHADFLASRYARDALQASFEGVAHFLEGAHPAGGAPDLCDVSRIVFSEPVQELKLYEREGLQPSSIAKLPLFTERHLPLFFEDKTNIGKAAPKRWAAMCKAYPIIAETSESGFVFAEWYADRMT